LHSQLATAKICEDIFLDAFTKLQKVTIRFIDLLQMGSGPRGPDAPRP